MVSQNLKNTLEILEGSVKRLIELQKKEDQVPDPEGYAEKVSNFKKTELREGLRIVREEKAEMLKSLHSTEDFKEHKDSQKYLHLSDLMEGIVSLLGPLDGEEVFSYPYKTDEDTYHELQECDDRIMSCISDLHNHKLLKSEHQEIVAILGKLKKLLETEFPFLKKDKTKGFSRPYVVQNYLLIRRELGSRKKHPPAIIFFWHLPKNILRDLFRWISWRLGRIFKTKP